MKLTKQRKVYLGILVVAVAALLLDRVFYSPDEASAAPDETSISTPRVADAPSRKPVLLPAACVEPSEVKVSIADRLAAAGAAEPIDLPGIRDAFRPEPEWMGELCPTGEVNKQDVDVVQAFRRRHRLMGVMLSSQGAKVIVDGEALEIGGKLDGFTLVSVESQTAVFSYGDRRVELTLPKDSPVNTQGE
jgi:hypothetical protein